ncbi:MAG TPA: phosphoribosylanthranilate isomerase [candidate division Zixibacteria bacterium]|nr:phosphoribosylanthranilate isomerase [candidate division Zixibacteria bacterium]
MTRPKIKICGLTRPSDVRTLNALGVDYAGFVFYRRSPRYVGVRRARMLSAALDPRIQPVGVFVDSSTESILRACQSIRATVAQIHGSLSVSAVLRLQRAGLRVAQAFAIRSNSDWTAVRGSVADFVLVDNATNNLRGGTGEPFDWSLGPSRAAPNLILAGGLNATNFVEGARRFQPAVLDFNSGVERSPGVKSRARLTELMERINRQDWKRIV